MRRLRQLFIAPPAEFAPMPFWFWNGDMQEAEIRRQMEDFFEKGVKGVILHPRMGIPKELDYLSDRFMELVRFAVDTAEEMGMLVILYDEGAYPSGSACGLVCRENPNFASRGIYLREEDGAAALLASERLVARVALTQTAPAAYAPGSARLLAPGESAQPGETVVQIIEGFTGGTIRGIHAGEDDGEPDAPKSGDLLNPDAMRCFFRLTHERYYETVGRHFGKTVIAMFTDEPSIMGRNARPDMRAWTWNLEDAWTAQGNSLAGLPALWWDTGDADDIRRAYLRFLTDRLMETYYRPLTDWCEQRGIALTGHPATPDDIALERLFGIPGQDVVWRFVAPEKRLGLIGQESTQGKCASDSARHFGKRRNSNECFGCCGPDGQQWAFTVDDMKWYLDWLFVRGANLIYPHAFFYAVDTQLRHGERPPDVGPNNYWWPYERQISDYTSRMCALITDGVNQARVAVLCSGVTLPWDIPAGLFERQIEFNYLEADLLEGARIEGGRIHVAAQAYDIVAVEDAKLLTAEVRAALDIFTAGGGKLLVLGGAGSETIETMGEGIAALTPRTVALSPACADIRATHIKHGETHLFLLTNEGECAWEGEVLLPAEGACERWDAWTGEMLPQGACPAALPLRLERRTSVIYITDPAGTATHPIMPLSHPDTALPVLMSWTASTPEGKRFQLDKLGDWQQWDGMALYTGTVTYESTFSLETVPERAALDLGMVREMAVVSVNGRPGQPLMLRPFILDITGMLRPGMNTLRVEVASSRVSFFDKIPWPAGLFGPVRLLGE